MLPNLRSWMVLTPRELCWCSLRPNSDGWGMSSAWGRNACKEVCCVESSCSARETKADQGWSKKRYKDNVNANLQWCNLESKKLEERASNRPRLWITFKDVQRQKLTAARDPRHWASSAVITTDFQCLHYSRLCPSSLWLRSHVCVHRWKAETTPLRIRRATVISGKVLCLRFSCASPQVSMKYYFWILEALFKHWLLKTFGSRKDFRGFLTGRALSLPKIWMSRLSESTKEDN